MVHTLITHKDTECEDELCVHSKLTKTENVHTSVCILLDAVPTHIEKINS